MTSEDYIHGKLATTVTAVLDNSCRNITHTFISFLELFVSVFL